MLTFILPGLYGVPAPWLNFYNNHQPLPALAALLGYAQRKQQTHTSNTVWLRDYFPLNTSNPGTVGSATITSWFDCPDSIDTNDWLRADPVHQRVDRDRAVLFDASVLKLNHEEAQQIVAALNSHFIDDGVQFVAATPQRWYVRFSPQLNICTTALHTAIGKDVRNHEPTGNDVLRWHTLLNEIQMLLYNHPVNNARELRGQPTVNALWLWGEAENAAPALSHQPILPLASNTQIYADEPLVRGLAQRANMHHAPLPKQFVATAAEQFFYLDTALPAACYGDAVHWQEAMQQLENDWFMPLFTAWQQGDCPDIRFVLPPTAEVNMPKTDMPKTDTQQILHAALGKRKKWQLWRRPIKHLASVLGTAA